jgi:hypothetical protein
MVMTSQEEIREAFMDYQSAKNGFERAKNWKSKAVLNDERFNDEDDE